MCNKLLRFLIVRCYKFNVIAIIVTLLSGCSVFTQSPVAVKMIEEFEYHCRNDIEVQCSASDCTVAKSADFTPMSVSFRHNGDLSICLYSGCYDTLATIKKESGFYTVLAAKVPFSTDVQSKKNIALSMDLKDQIAVVKVGSFAQPLRCNAI